MAGAEIDGHKQLDAALAQQHGVLLRQLLPQPARLVR